MPLASSGYRQTATYWGAPTQGGFGGVSFGAPTKIACRWEEIGEVFIDSTGREATSAAIVYTHGELEEGGYLAKGDKTAYSDPTLIKGAYEIRKSVEIPDLRGLNYERRAYL